MALGYKVAIFNVWWRRGEVDTRFFSSKTDQKTYFDSMSLTFNDLNNFNINDNITTVIIFRDTSKRSITELLHCNYAIVWDTKADTYRYFFITSIKQDSSNQLVVSLDLDDIQNNLIGNIDKLGSVYLKRWTGHNLLKESNKYKYPVSLPISLLLTEDNPVLYNKKTEDVKVEFTDNATINTWLFNNVECWRYVFITQNKRIYCNALDTVDTNEGVYLKSTCSNVINDKKIRLPYYSVCGPRYKKNSTKRIYIKYKYTFGVDEYTYYELLEDTNIDELFWLSGKIHEGGIEETVDNYPIGTYGIEDKLSNLPPFTDTSFLILGSITIDGDGDLIINCVIATDQYQAAITYGGYDNQLGLTDMLRFYSIDVIPKLNRAKSAGLKAVCSGYYLSKTTFDASCTNPIRTDDILDSNLMNYKLMDSNYTKLRLRVASQHYEYNPLAYKIDYSANNGNLKLKYTEVLKTGNSKIYLRLEHSGNYTTYMENDYTGLIGALDLSEPLLSNQWQDYLASNKNYNFQLGLNYGFNAVRNLGSIVNSSANAGARGGAWAGYGQFASGVLDYTLQFGQQYYNDQIFKDNIVSAPDSVANANGDPYFVSEVSGIRPKVDLLQADNYMLLVALEKMSRVGIPYNQLIINTDLQYLFESHVNYDIMSFDINYTDSLNISEREYERLKNKCGQVNRYWYSDTVDYTDPNYLDL